MSRQRNAEIGRERRRPGGCHLEAGVTFRRSRCALGGRSFRCLTRVSLLRHGYEPADSRNATRHKLLLVSSCSYNRVFQW